ncbi:YheT family hydrolase [Aureitalea marina]|uniref:Alpha/beta hydrolase n=1 Tax=Aureitalea marina TaxID=930804 RepID=A0A2S7KRS2_9FLAO|nr:alpha/beta fold hydrolase [Aureitalea marina]PQB05310.1 alpha/beta hydrolase [Aureitalea marina]
MPIISSSYRAFGPFKNGHFSTIYSAKLRPAITFHQERERIGLPDGDYVDLDFHYQKPESNKIVVLLHGLEGNAQRSYIKGQARVLQEDGWDLCAMNYRGCSGSDNLLYRSYNAGATEDLEEVIRYISEKDRYDEICLIGFSLGGNLLLKYLGEERDLSPLITKAVAISTPLSLRGSLEELTKWYNWVYRTTFLRYLRKKYKRKMPTYPEQMSQVELKQIRNLLEFDHRYTAKAHGYLDAWDYYNQCSSVNFLAAIDRPILILNALNDSFLSPDCYPEDLATKSKKIYLEMPQHGGHVGFVKAGNIYYSETRARDFLKP